MNARRAFDAARTRTPNDLRPTSNYRTSRKPLTSGFSLWERTPMTFSSEQVYQIIIAALGILGTLVTGYAIRLRGDVKVNELRAQSDFDENTTQNVAIKTITDRYARKDDENTQLQRELRESAVRETEQAGMIKELRSMVVSLGDRNTTQSKMMRELAGVMESQKQLLADQREIIDAQSVRIQMLEAEKPKDGIEKDKPP